ncbi:MAG: MopE-related protein [Polyangiales bacterium]
MRSTSVLRAAVYVSLLTACAAEDRTPFALDGGANTGRDAASATDRGVAVTDAGGPMDGGSTVTPDDVPPAGDVVSVYDTATASDGCATGATCMANAEGCQARETCGNGLDDDCNGRPDDGCACIPGTVQDCFLGPPLRRGVGQCSGGTQRCEGSGEFGAWGACAGAIGPSSETCDNLDNDCNGCVDEGLCCGGELSCPGADDPRVPDGRPFAAYGLRGEMFYTGTARSWRWEIRGGPCDAVLPRPTFTTYGLDTRVAAFVPTLSGDYTVTLTVVTGDGRTLTCTFVVHIVGPGMRVELCWDTSTTVDLDLYVHDPRNTDPWFDNAGMPITSVNNNSCNWSNCEANIRGTRGRVSWGYASSPLANCESGPFGAGWRAVGSCANPRLDIDNNLVKASGVPENMNVDNPRDGERFRVMVQNFTGTAAHPVLNVYCGGRLRGTLWRGARRGARHHGPLKLPVGGRDVARGRRDGARRRERRDHGAAQVTPAAPAGSSSVALGHARRPELLEANDAPVGAMADGSARRGWRARFVVRARGSAVARAPPRARERTRLRRPAPPPSPRRTSSRSLPGRSDAAVPSLAWCPRSVPVHLAHRARD